VIRSSFLQQLESTSCAFLFLLDILRWGFGPPRLPSPIPLVWVKHFRVHWLHILLLKGATPCDPEALHEPHLWRTVDRHAFLPAISNGFLELNRALA
jgi:hypothetical protein